MLSDTDHQSAASGLDHILADCAETVDSHDAFDLNEQAVEQPKVASGCAYDGCDSLRIAEVSVIKGEDAFRPASQSVCPLLKKG